MQNILPQDLQEQIKSFNKDNWYIWYLKSISYYISKSKCIFKIFINSKIKYFDQKNSYCKYLVIPDNRYHLAPFKSYTYYLTYEPNVCATYDDYLLYKKNLIKSFILKY